MTPEEAIETGIYNRLTSATYGITTEATDGYVSQSDGIQLWQGQVDLTPEGMALWAGSSTIEGPKVLIIAGDDVKYEHDFHTYAQGTYTVDLYIAASHGRDPHEAIAGDDSAAPDTGSPGIWQVKSDILDRLLNHPIVTEADPPYLISGRTVVRQGSTVLYRLTLGMVVATLHQLSAWSDLDNLSKIRTTMTKEPSEVLVADDFITEVDADLP